MHESVEEIGASQQEGLVGPLSINLANAPLQEGIRDFLKRRTAYDVLPVSFRLIVLDTSLFVRKSLNILVQNSRSITEGSGLI